MLLYHGTCLERFDLTDLETLTLNPAERGDCHLSLSSSFNVARHFAEMAIFGEAVDRQLMVEGKRERPFTEDEFTAFQERVRGSMKDFTSFIFIFDKKTLEKNGIMTEPYSSTSGSFGELDAELEYAVHDIPVPVQLASNYHQLKGRVHASSTLASL